VATTPGPECLAALAPAEWRDAFRAAAREHFIPPAAWAAPMTGGPGHWIDYTDDPTGWQAAVYSDTTIVTQVDDGASILSPQTAQAKPATCSSTAPGLVASFLTLLEPSPGDRVLEVGTGTGWTAALLSAQVGDQRVTTVEVDPELARRAAANLRRAGYSPGLVTGDGAAGGDAHIPFDRMHVTCAVRRVPHSWVRQTRPGGVLVLPWSPTGALGFRLRLTCHGGSAAGRLHGEAGFMLLRAQQPGYPPPAQPRRERTSEVDPRRILAAGRGFEVALAALMPEVVLNTSLHGRADWIGLRHPASAS
jgi:protein-L-isoaspartate O-methyltransferase